MTVKDAFVNHGYWVAPLPKANRQQVIDWWVANFPNDPYRTVAADADTVCFRPYHFDLLFGFPYEAEDPSHLDVPTIQRLRDALLVVKDRRIVLPVTGAGSVRDTSFYAYNGNVYIPNFGLITNADFIDLATFVRNDADPDV